MEPLEISCQGWTSEFPPLSYRFGFYSDGHWVAHVEETSSPPPSLPYTVDTSRPSLRTNWTRKVPAGGTPQPPPACFRAPFIISYVTA